MIIEAILCAVFSITIPAGSLESSREYNEIIDKNVTAAELVETLWKDEVESPLPNYRMTRNAFGIETNGNYSIEEKAEYVYRARELRRGYRLVLRYKEIRSKPAMDAGDRTKSRKVHALSIRHQKFLESDKGKKMVDYLKGTQVGVDGLIDYLIKQENFASERATTRETRKLGSKTIAIGDLSREEQVNWLYRRIELLRLKSKKEKSRKVQVRLPKENVQRKPPVKPFRVRQK